MELYKIVNICLIKNIKTKYKNKDYLRVKQILMLL